MAEKEIKRKGTIGTSSLILIFIVLCLATFGLLSLSNAAGDLKLARKNAEAARTYYEADRQGEEFAAMVDQTLRADREESGREAGRLVLCRQRLGEYYREETGTVETDIPMQFGQALHITLQPEEGEEPFSVAGWRVYNREEYGIDDSMPVWTGGDEK